MHLNGSVKFMIVWSAVVLVGGFLGESAMAATAKTGSKRGNPHTALRRDADTVRILSSLEGKIGGEKLLEKVKDKLSALDDAQVRLLASLSERMANHGSAAGADLAFLLLTALIILF